MTSQATALTPHPGRRSGYDNSDSMVLAVEASRLAREVRGIGRYVRALLPRLLQQREGLRIVLYVKRMGEADRLRAIFSKDVIDRVSIKPAAGLARSGADVFWYPWNTIGPTPRRGCVVVTMHDVVPIAHPDPRIRGTYKNMRWKGKFRATARRADLIITDSAFSASEIRRTLGVRQDHIRVVLLAADDFAPDGGANDAALLAQLGVAKPYLLAVGASDRRKNLGLLDAAMPQVVESLPECSLVLAGPRKRTNAENPAWRRTLGFVTDGDLAALFRGALALVQPSTYEGFGLPVLEAMQLGTPVICAQASSLPEVAGDAAAWIDPNDASALARAVVAIATDEGRRAAMVRAGVAQAARFSWDETARQTLDAFDFARSRYMKMQHG